MNLLLIDPRRAVVTSHSHIGFSSTYWRTTCSRRLVSTGKRVDATGDALAWGALNRDKPDSAPPAGTDHPGCTKPSE